MRIIYPPLNFTGEKRVNRSLFQSESIHILKWQSNPNNLNIVGYRIYEVDGESRSLLVEVDANTFEYWHRDVLNTKPYTYALVGINDQNREGDPAYVTVH